MQWSTNATTLFTSRQIQNHIICVSRKKIPSIIQHSKKAHEKGGNMRIGLAFR